jgi:hypothetical protein
MVYYYDRKYHTFKIFFSTLKMTRHSGFCSFNPGQRNSVKKHLAAKRFATGASVKPSPPAYRHLTPLSSKLDCKHWCHGGTDAYMSMLTTLGSDVCHLLLPVCPACIRVSIKFSVTEYYLPNPLKLILLLWSMLTVVSHRKEGITEDANKDNLSYMRKILVYFLFTKSQL